MQRGVLLSSRGRSVEATVPPSRALGLRRMAGEVIWRRDLSARAGQPGEVRWGAVVLSPPDDARRTRQLESKLTLAESAAADRLRVPSARSSYVAAHAALRSLVGRACGSGTFAGELGREQDGRPFVRELPEATISLSHTTEAAAAALAFDARIGIDVERMRPLPDVEPLALANLSQEEAAWVLSVRGAPRAARFLRCWVAKEAWLKAIGRGLHCPLQEFAVLPGEDGGLEARLSISATLQPWFGPAARWSVFEIPTGDPDLFAAVALETGGSRTTQGGAKSRR